MPPADLATLVHAALLYAVAEVALRVAPVQRVCSWFRVPLAFGEHQLIYPSQAPWLVFDDHERRKKRAVQRLAPHLYGDERGCLRRALVLGHLLRQRNPTLHLGVRRTAEGTFGAHAWIEIEGVRLEPDTGWAPFAPVQ